MNNPFVEIKPDVEVSESEEEHRQKLAKRDAIYLKYDPMVNDILDLFIAAHRQGAWEKDSDCSRRYCCHVAWFAGPKEIYSDPYDKNHTLRRRLEIRLDVDGLCNPSGFTVIRYGTLDKVIHVGLERDDLVRGVMEVMK